MPGISRMAQVRGAYPQAMTRVDAARARVRRYRDSIAVPAARHPQVEKASRPVQVPRPIREIISPEDRVQIRGKDHICKSGIVKIAAEYRMSTESTAMDLPEISGDIMVTVKVSVTDPAGRITERTASAAKSEGKEIQHLASTAETRAYGRAVLAAVGSGECSAEEMRGTEPQIMSREERGRLLDAARAASPS